jgi:hypothetical protein
MQVSQLAHLVEAREKAERPGLGGFRQREYKRGY